MKRRVAITVVALLALVASSVAQERPLKKVVFAVTTKDISVDLIYVNGSNNLESLKTADETWKVRLIEDDFQRLMFDTYVA